MPSWILAFRRAHWSLITWSYSTTRLTVPVRRTSKEATYGPSPGHSCFSSYVYPHLSCLFLSISSIYRPSYRDSDVTNHMHCYPPGTCTRLSVSRVPLMAIIRQVTAHNYRPSPPPINFRAVHHFPPLGHCPLAGRQHSLTSEAWTISPSPSIPSDILLATLALEHQTSLHPDSIGSIPTGLFPGDHATIVRSILYLNLFYILVPS